ncbi:MAG: hypothetical protein WCP21_17470, partial [Armatimonadota bacterium]
MSARGGARGAWLLTLLRALTLALTLMAVANPGWLRTVVETDRPRLVILRDVSASMDLAAAGGPTRRQQADSQLAADASAKALGRFEVTSLPFADGLAQSGRQVTDLAKALRQASDLYEPRSILVVSDGAETTGDARLAAAQQAARGIRVDVLGVGASIPPPDVGPVTLTAPRVVKEDQPFPLGVSVSVHGYTGPQALSVA